MDPNTPKLESDDVKPHNQLLPPEVLERLLAFLPTPSLRTSRLVNPAWAKAAIVPLRKKCAPISFGFQARIGGPGGRSSYGHENLETFVACFNASRGNFPVSEYQMTLSPFDNAILEHENSVDTFFNCVSPIVTNLTLTFGLGQSRLRIWPGDYQYPQLTSLTLKAEFYMGSVRTPVIYPHETFNFIERIITHAPNLHTLSLEFGERFLGVVGPCLDVITGRNILLQRITHLQLNVCQTEELGFTSLNSLHGMRLTTMKLIGGWHQFHHTAITLGRFLESQKDTLKALEIQPGVVTGRGIFFLMMVPALPKLEFLKTGKDILTDPIISSGNFPALKRVHFESSMLDPAFDNAPFVLVEELVISGFIFQKSSIEMMSTRFPNVTTLRVFPMYEQVVNGIYESFTGLTELQLTTDRILDSADTVITGLSKRQLDMLETEIGLKGQPIKFCWRRQLYLSKPKSVSALRNLKVLRLQCTLATKLEFGLISSYVLKKMESLKQIDLGVRCFPPSNKRIQRVIRDLREEKLVLYRDKS